MTLREKILPMPSSAEEKNSEFMFDGNIEVLFNEDGFDAESCALYNRLWHGFSYGGALSFKKSADIKPHTICTAGYNDFPDLGEYEYAISVGRNGFCMVSSGTTGLIHALVSLMQLISPRALRSVPKQLYIPCGIIKDKPVLNFRSVHLCVFPETTLDFIERSITMAGFAKYSHIIIEFWGMIKFDCADFMSWNNAYTKDEIRPFIKLAKTLGMEVIPMLNHFGHASMSRVISGKHVALDNDPSAALLFEPDGWTWCLSNPDTIALLKLMREELAELCGSGKYFHFGCDEAYSFATCDICSKKDKLKMLTDYLNYLADEAKAMGRKPIIWGDMFLDSQKWDKKYYALSWPEHGTHKIINNISRDLIIADWQYEVTDINVETAAYFKKKGFNVVLCPWDNFKNITALGEYAKQENIFGAIATTWHTLYQNFYMLFCAAESFWSVLDRDEMDKYGYIIGRKYENYELIMAKYLRFIFPSKGRYTKSGWHEYQISAGGESANQE